MVRATWGTVKVVDTVTVEEDDGRISPAELVQGTTVVWWTTIVVAEAGGVAVAVR